MVERRLVAVLLALFGAACSSGPDIETCFRGGFFATCGEVREGEGPVLACSESEGECAWFDGEVAATFQASDCDPQAVCCHDDWPFDGSDYEDQLGWDLVRWGTKPWDRDRAMNLTVRIDGEVQYQPIVCEGEDPTKRQLTRSICDDVTLKSGRIRAADTVTFRASADAWASPWVPIVEVDPERMVARLCTGRTTDVVPTTCHPFEVLCADRGEVILSGDPRATGTITIAFDAYFGAFHITGGFSVESAPPP